MFEVELQYSVYCGLYIGVTHLVQQLSLARGQRDPLPPGLYLECCLFFIVAC